MGQKRFAPHQKRAHKLNAVVVFVDEAGLLLSPLVKRSWEPRGETPVIRTKTRSHRKISAIEGLTTTARGRKQGLVFRLHSMKNVGAAECVAFLEQLELNFPGRHVFVIWDGLRAHWSKKVDRWLLRHRKFQTFKLPPYAPAALEGESWVVDGNYTNKTKDIIWPQADALVWLDPPLAIILFRFFTRSFSRYVRGELLWGHSRETLRKNIFSRNSLLAWILTTHKKKTEAYLRLVGEPPKGVVVHRLRTDSDIEQFFRKLFGAMK